MSTTSPQTKTSISDRIRALKASRAKAVLENRREVYNEASGVKEKVLEKQRLQDELNKDDAEDEELDKPDEKKKGLLDLKDLEYTGIETDVWYSSQGNGKTTSVTEDGDKELQNFKQLADQTYTKSIKELKKSGVKSKENYTKEKEMYATLKKEGLTEEEIRDQLTTKKDVDKYVAKVKKWENEVYQRRSKLDRDGIDGAIHEKNRQFNSKLKRHYDQI